ncbi:hypothetical protein [Quatrionicoccus australiensis]|uniref:hypothetical protein n=1 Tax=Quatrionicoccus australiensis TaxID=138118 RepID=UPI001CF9C9CF|nr:hypothetical protein [Quatrionicoccus australiensis]MCB4358396.1 hypothetical protein [Quatrionicoccus australiensis]
MAPASVNRRLIFVAALLAISGVGLTGFPFEVDLWGINEQVGLALALAIPFSLVWAGFASPRGDIRRAAFIVALPVLPITLLCWLVMSFSAPFIDGMLDEANSGVVRYRLYRVAAFDADPLGIVLQREIDLLPGLRIFWKLCGDTYESAGKISRITNDEVEVRAGERLVLSCRL